MDERRPFEEFRGSRRLRSDLISVIGLSAVAVVVSTVFGASPAAATISPGPHLESSHQVRSFDEASIANARVRSDAIRGDQTRLRARASEYLQEAARRGSVVDRRELWTATLADPYSPGETIDLLWHGMQIPGKLDYGRTEDSNGSVTQGVGFEMVPDLTLKREAAPNVRGGSGYESGYWPTNLYLQDRGHGEVYFAAEYGGPSSRIQSWYEAWSPTTCCTADWVYNRWGNFLRASNWDKGYESVDRFITDYTVASRPWKGLEYRISALNDFKPPGPTTNCPGTQSFTLSAFGVGLTMNMHQCSTKLQLSSFSSKKIMMDLFADGQGQQTSDNQIYMDVAGQYHWTGPPVSWPPVWADYNYAEVRTCHYAVWPTWPCGSPAAYTYKDSGW